MRQTARKLGRKTFEIGGELEGREGDVDLIKMAEVIDTYASVHFSGETLNP